jgi:hypothetical protein
MNDNFVLLAVLFSFFHAGLSATDFTNAQFASSSSYFQVNNTQASGGIAKSEVWFVHANFGEGVVAEFTSSSSFQILGGFNASTRWQSNNKPALAAVVPGFAPLFGGRSAMVHGFNLAQGTFTNILIDGQAATVVNRAPDYARVIMPFQVSPGWKTVVATTPEGTAFLPRGVGILPMADLPHPVVRGAPFRITYRGTNGDLVYLAVSGSLWPAPVPIPPYFHGLELAFGRQVHIAGPLLVVDPSGELHLDFPGLPLPKPLYVQMLAIPQGNPGYGPGCFTNVLEL